MEFLMTYGWALLVVLIAIGALAFFGLLNPSRFLPERCDVGTGLQCVGFNAENGGDTITIFLNNGIGQMMRDVNVSLDQCDDSPVWGFPDDGNYNHAEGATKRYIFSDCGGTAANSRFRTEVSLNYTTVIEGQTLTHTRRGVLSVNVQE